MRVDESTDGIYMYTFIYICIYICMIYVYIYICIDICIYICIYIYIYVYIGDCLTLTEGGNRRNLKKNDKNYNNDHDNNIRKIVLKDNFLPGDNNNSKNRNAYISNENCNIDVDDRNKGDLDPR
jgi:hypothetical protein